MERRAYAAPFNRRGNFFAQRNDNYRSDAEEPGFAAGKLKQFCKA
jgi:hypothetical protein